VVEIVDRCDAVCVPGASSKNEKVAFIQNKSVDKTCNRTLTVPKHMKAPIYVYMSLTTFTRIIEGALEIP
ncbi:hypothetical protein FRX31_016019, partial [Thalictrum thalictroides]